MGNNIQVGFDILGSVVDKVTGKILLQLGNAAQKTVDTTGVEQWLPYGFASRPCIPTGKDAGQAVVLRTGDHDIAIACIDMRTLGIYGNIADGEACAYSAGEDGKGQSRTIWKKDGSINHYTTDTNTEDGQAVYERIAPDGISWVAPWGSVKFDATGFHINHISGAQLSLGGIYGMPFPLSEMSSYVRMQAGTMNVTASAQSFGGEEGHDNLAGATGTMAAISALQSEIDVISKCLIALGGAVLTGGPATVAAVQPAVTAAESALAIATAVIPTTTSST